MKWILVVFFMRYNALSTESIPGFETYEACYKAGQQVIEMKTLTTDANFRCVSPK